MDKDNIKGKINDVTGRIKRQAGEWTGNEELQEEGTRDQAKGKMQDAWGNVKEGARELKEDVKDLGRDVEHDSDPADNSRRRDKDAA
jgi:uncharacterized protein YjbJ (UPF0337 family)